MGCKKLGKPRLTKSETVISRAWPFY